MTDPTTQLILDALSRAAIEPSGVPLYRGKWGPGLFPATAPARPAAQRCREEELVRQVGTAVHGSSTVELCCITEKGLTYLLRECNPRPILEDLVRALEARQDQLAQMQDAVQRSQASLEAIKSLAEKVLAQLPTAQLNGSAWPQPLLERLRGWHSQHEGADCPLPELYRALSPNQPGLTIGRFHDALRQLHESSKISLQPWPGPLYEMPEPAYAVLVGHMIAYYVSLR